jgi:glycosyltransferase involved in cell wall biosynthesis
LVHVDQPCAYDDEIHNLGSRIIRCLYPSQPGQYAHRFRQILRSYQPDVVHSHVGYFSGYILRLAHQENIPVRIAHSHNDFSMEEKQASWQRRIYITLMQQWIKHYATLGLGCSGKAIASLLGTWKLDPRWQLLYCGIDLTPFQDQVNSTQRRQELGIPQNAFVIGHVGRFTEQKNHTFLVEIVSEVAKREPRTHLLLVGEGELQSSIEQKVTHLGLTNRVTFAGSRSDIPKLMQGVMDVFLLPSLHEGLPLVLLEAQAAGLHSIISNIITSEVDQSKLLIHRLPLSQHLSVWADAILAEKPVSTITSLKTIEQIKASPFNIQNSIKELEKLYLEQYQQHIKPLSIIF